MALPTELIQIFHELLLQMQQQAGGPGGKTESDKQTRKRKKPKAVEDEEARTASPKNTVKAATREALAGMTDAFKSAGGPKPADMGMDLGTVHDLRKYSEANLVMQGMPGGQGSTAVAATSAASPATPAASSSPSPAKPHTPAPFGPSTLADLGARNAAKVAQAKMLAAETPRATGNTSAGDTRQGSFSQFMAAPSEYWQDRALGSNISIDKYDARKKAKEGIPDRHVTSGGFSSHIQPPAASAEVLRTKQKIRESDKASTGGKPLGAGGFSEILAPPPVIAETVKPITAEVVQDNSTFGKAKQRVSKIGRALFGDIHDSLSVMTEAASSPAKPSPAKPHTPAPFGPSTLADLTARNAAKVAQVKSPSPAKPHTPAPFGPSTLADLGARNAAKVAQVKMLAAETPRVRGLTPDQSDALKAFPGATDSAWKTDSTIPDRPVTPGGFSNHIQPPQASAEVLQTRQKIRESDKASTGGKPLGAGGFSEILAPPPVIAETVKPVMAEVVEEKGFKGKASRILHQITSRATKVAKNVLPEIFGSPATAGGSPAAGGIGSMKSIGQSLLKHGVGFLRETMGMGAEAAAGGSAAGGVGGAAVAGTGAVAAGTAGAVEAGAVGAGAAGAAAGTAVAAGGAAAAGGGAAAATGAVAAGAGLTVASGPAAPIVGTIVAMGLLTTAAVSAVKGIKEFGESVIESNRELARWSPEIARTIMMSDRQNMMLAANDARATGGSLSMAGGQVASLKENWQPLSNLMGTIKNVGVGTLAAVGNKIMEKLNYIIVPIAKLAEFCDHLMGTDTKKTPFAQLVSDMKSGMFWGKEMQQHHHAPHPKNQRVEGKNPWGGHHDPGVQGGVH